ncbi:SDR family oxidoreductase, partial [Kaistella carnis]|uniref:SDR family oxidoreductase n=1 Tax=Kaistella carnis TaxID=1241979 RepID=UPI0028AEC610
MVRRFENTNYWTVILGGSSGLGLASAKKLASEGMNICIIHRSARAEMETINQSLSTDDFSITLQAMATSLYDWTKIIFNENLFAEDARILAFTSEGSTKPINNYGAVSAAKAALEAISRNIALEFAPFGLRSNCIQAGVTDTRSLQMIPGSEEIKEITKKRNPFKRLTNPEDVANVVSLLCQDEASWINGCIIPVDGGVH